jgi:hypothetical protein
MAKENAEVQPAGADPARLADLEKGLQQLYKGQWSSAQKSFSAVAEGARGSALVDRARQYLEICRDRLEEGTGDGDAYLSAVVAKNAGELETVREACSRGGLKGRDSRFAYLAASVEALAGDAGEASRLLEKAIELDPQNRVLAFWDPDFEEVRDEPELADIFATE